MTFKLNNKRSTKWRQCGDKWWNDLNFESTVSFEVGFVTSIWTVSQIVQASCHFRNIKLGNLKRCCLNLFWVKTVNSRCNTGFPYRGTTSALLKINKKRSHLNTSWWRGSCTINIYSKLKQSVTDKWNNIQTTQISSLCNATRCSIVHYEE